MSVFENELAASCWSRHLEDVWGCLERGYPVDHRDNQGVTPLQICASLGWTDAVSLLLKYGADVNLECPMGWTALMQAVRNGHTETVDTLLEAGAKTNVTNSLGWGLASLAVSSNNDGMLAKLAHQAKPPDLNLALAVACQMGAVDAVKLLLKQRVNINETMADSKVTPLMLAASEGHEKIVEILLSVKANPKVTSSCNLTALDMALMNGHNGTASILSVHRRISPSITSLSPFPSTQGFSPFDGILPQAYQTHSKTAVSPNSLSSYTPVQRPGSPQIFQFPPSPNFPYMPTIYQPYCQSSPQSQPHTPFPVFSISPSFCHCTSPSHASPVIPRWMFSPRQRHSEIQSKFSVRNSKRIRNWWKKLKKRCKGKKRMNRIKIYVSYDKDSMAPYERQFEELLSSLDLDSLVPILKQHEIDATTFQHLSEKDLEEIGIVDKNLQCTVLQKISSLNGKVLKTGGM